MFSDRLNINFESNLLTELYNKKISSGERIFDLTLTNPTKLNFNYDKHLLKKFIDDRSYTYNPNPNGLISTRENIIDYYRKNEHNVSLDEIFITSSTSESYSFLFKLLCNPDDEILIPQPCYPLFDYLAMLDSVSVSYYKLFYDSKLGWQTDFKVLSNLINAKTKAIVIINPNNPTGSYISKKEYEKFLDISRKNNIPLIVDEVFSDYKLEEDKNILQSVIDQKNVITFVLNGISKMLALPQMKLGWIVVKGQKKYTEEAVKRLEIICDTYLSVSTPIQYASDILFATKAKIQGQIIDRIKTNYNFLQGKFLLNPDIRVLKFEGGWSAILSFENLLIPEDHFIYNLLDRYNVFIHPGFYYDFWKENYAVISLLTEPDILEEGVERILQYYKGH